MANSKKPKLSNPSPATKPPRPDFAARAKQTPDGDLWITIGYAWFYERVRGELGYTVTLHTIPTNWDGSFYLAPFPKKSDR
jgi:hypothetical protein